MKLTGDPYDPGALPPWLVLFSDRYHCIIVNKQRHIVLKVCLFAWSLAQLSPVDKWPKCLWLLPVAELSAVHRPSHVRHIETINITHTVNICLFVLFFTSINQQIFASVTTYVFVTPIVLGVLFVCFSCKWNFAHCGKCHCIGDFLNFNSCFSTPRCM